MYLDYYKDRHKGKNAIIVAAGPSLRYTDIDAFDEDWFRLGVSLVYQYVDDIDYQFIGDRHIFSQVWDDFVLGHPFQQLFVSNGIYQQFGKKINTKNISYFTGGGEKKFYTDITKGTYGGGTSTFLAMQFAYYMGFDAVYIVGLDHSWDFSATEEIGAGTGGKILRHTDKDVNHFSDTFYNKEISWYKPKEDKMLESYAMASKVFKDAGRLLMNASLQTQVPDSIITRAPKNVISYLRLQNVN